MKFLMNIESETFMPEYFIGKEIKLLCIEGFFGFHISAKIDSLLFIFAFFQINELIYINMISAICGFFKCIERHINT